MKFCHFVLCFLFVNLFCNIINVSFLKKRVEEKSDDLLSCGNLVEIENFDDEITHLLRSLVQSGWRQHLTWIQDCLLETCYVKLGKDTNCIFSIFSKICIKKNNFCTDIKGK